MLPTLSSTASPFQVVTVRVEPLVMIRPSIALTTIVLLLLPPVSWTVSKMPVMFSTIALTPDLAVAGLAQHAVARVRIL